MFFDQLCQTKVYLCIIDGQVQAQYISKYVNWKQCSKNDETENKTKRTIVPKIPWTWTFLIEFLTLWWNLALDSSLSLICEINVVLIKTNNLQRICMEINARLKEKFSYKPLLLIIFTRADSRESFVVIFFPCNTFDSDIIWYKTKNNLEKDWKSRSLTLGCWASIVAPIVCKTCACFALQSVFHNKISSICKFLFCWRRNFCYILKNIR